MTETKSNKEVWEEGRRLYGLICKGCCPSCGSYEGFHEEATFEWDRLPHECKTCHKLFILYTQHPELTLLVEDDMKQEALKHLYHYMMETSYANEEENQNRYKLPPLKKGQQEDYSTTPLTRRAKRKARGKQRK